MFITLVHLSPDKKSFEADLQYIKFGPTQLQLVQVVEISI